MTNKSPNKVFRRRVRRGRKFEKWERTHWKGGINDLAEFEAPTQWEGKRGRVDIRLIDDQEGHTIVAEIKATDWNAMKPHRIRPNVLRHARQIWRYIGAELENQSVIPALIYSRPPKSIGRKDQIEAVLNEHLIQVVWREDYEE
jgi:hypothetical protein